MEALQSGESSVTRDDLNEDSGEDSEKDSEKDSEDDQNSGDAKSPPSGHSFCHSYVGNGTDISILDASKTGTKGYIAEPKKIEFEMRDFGSEVAVPMINYRSCVLMLNFIWYSSWLLLTATPSVFTGRAWGSLRGCRSTAAAVRPSTVNCS